MQTIQNNRLTEIVKILDTMRPRTEKVTLETNIVRDLGLDSVEVMDFVMTLEDHFDISIPLDKIAEVETLNDLCGVIETVSKSSVA